MDFLQSILIVSGNSDSRLAKAKKISPLAFEISPTGIEEIRETRKIVALGQSVILKDAHHLTEEAQNALLKTLEEPPENVHIILLAQDSEFLLPTIISRCQIIELPSAITILAAEEQKELEKILNWIGDLPAGRQGDIKNGFAWAKENTDRKNALEQVDKLLIATHQNLKSPTTIKKLFAAKKYLSANANVRLTLENLFINW